MQGGKFENLARHGLSPVQAAKPREIALVPLESKAGVQYTFQVGSNSLWRSSISRIIPLREGKKASSQWPQIANPLLRGVRCSTYSGTIVWFTEYPLTSGRGEDFWNGIDGINGDWKICRRPMPWYITGDGCVMHRDCIISSTATPLEEPKGNVPYRNENET